MATTTNYGWTTPDDTALVKDGAAAIRTLGTSIDTTTKNLNPSTTLGDIEYRSSTANTNTRLGIGSTGQVLTVTGGVPAWGTASGGLSLISTTTFTSVASQSLNSIFTSTYTNYKIILNLTSTVANEGMRLRMRASGTDATGSNYLIRNIYISGNATFGSEYSTQTTAYFGSASTGGGIIVADILNPNLAQRTYVSGQNVAETENQIDGIVHNLSTAYDGVTIYTSGGTNMTGTISVYGYQK